jgi:hypothetical protein
LLILLVAAGSISLAALAYQKMNFAVSYAADVQSRLGASQARADDLAEQVKELQTLNELQGKADETVWKEYSSPNITVDYPEDATVVKATADFPALTIKTAAGKVEIFRMKDFPGGKRDASCAGCMGWSEAELDAAYPRETKTAVGSNTTSIPYDVWIYYGHDDAAAKALMDKIVASIRINK